MTCSDSSGKALSCTLVKATNSSNGQPLTNVTISAAIWCKSSTSGCDAGDSLTLVLSNAKNPGYIVSSISTSVELSTFNLINSQYLLIDQLKMGVSFANQLVPGALSQASLSRTGSTLTGGVPSY